MRADSLFLHCVPRPRIPPGGTATHLTDRGSRLTAITASLVQEKLCPFVWNGMSHQRTSQILWLTDPDGGMMVTLDTSDKISSKLTNALWARSKLALATKGVIKTSHVNITNVCFFFKAVMNLLLAKSQSDNTTNSRKLTSYTSLTFKVQDYIFYFILLLNNFLFQKAHHMYQSIALIMETFVESCA